MTGNVAVDVDCTGHTRDVSGKSFDVEADCGGLAAEALGTDAESVDLFEHFLLEVSVVRIGMAGIDGSHDSLLCKESRLIEGAADSDADNDGRTGVGACSLNGLDDEVLNALKTCGGLKHTDSGHILASEALGANGDLEVLAGNDLGVDHCGSVVAGVAAANGVAYYGLTEITVGVSSANALVDSVAKVAANDMYVLADLEEYASHTGILTDRYVLVICDLEVLDDVIKNTLSDLAVLASAAILDCTLNVGGKMSVSIDTKLFYCINDLLYVNFTHFLSFSYKNRLTITD